MRVGNFKIDKDRDGEIRGFTYVFDEPFNINLIGMGEMLSDEPYHEELKVINKIQGELRSEKAKIKKLQKITELEAEIRKLKSELMI